MDFTHNLQELMLDSAACYSLQSPVIFILRALYDEYFIEIESI